MTVYNATIACRGSELPLNVSTQLLHPFSDTVTDLVFEFGSEVRLRHDRLLITVVCLHTGFWKPDNITGQSIVDPKLFNNYLYKFIPAIRFCDVVFFFFTQL